MGKGSGILVVGEAAGTWGRRRDEQTVWERSWVLAEKGLISLPLLFSLWTERWGQVHIPLPDSLRFMVPEIFLLNALVCQPRFEIESVRCLVICVFRQVVGFFFCKWLNFNLTCFRALGVDLSGILNWKITVYVWIFFLIPK